MTTKNNYELLKWTLNNQDSLTELPIEVFTDWQSRILHEWKLQAKIIDKPSLKSIAKEIMSTLNREDINSFKAEVQEIAKADTIDEAGYQLNLFKARSQASVKVMQKIVLLSEDPANQKDVDKLWKRVQELKEFKVEQQQLPINAKQWNLLERAEEEEVYIGIDWLTDNNVPIKKKVLYSFVATTNGGKTIIKTWFAVKLIRAGQNILYIAQEEPREDTIRRVYQSCLGLTEEQYFNRTRVSFEEVGKEFIAKSQEKGWGEFIVVEWPGIKIDKIKERLLKYQEDNNITIDGIVVDYAKLVDTTKTNTNAEWERIGNIFSELKQTAMALNIYVITSIQLNREGTKELIKNGTAPSLSNVSGAFEATHHCNYIWSVKLDYTPENERDRVETPSSVKGQFTLFVLKSKYGKLRANDAMRFEWTADHNLVEKAIPTVQDITIPDELLFPS